MTAAHVHAFALGVTHLQRSVAVDAAGSARLQGWLAPLRWCWPQTRSLLLRPKQLDALPASAIWQTPALTCMMTSKLMQLLRSTAKPEPLLCTLWSDNK